MCIVCVCVVCVCVCVCVTDVGDGCTQNGCGWIYYTVTQWMSATEGQYKHFPNTEGKFTLTFLVLCYSCEDQVLTHSPPQGKKMQHAFFSIFTSSRYFPNPTIYSPPFRSFNSSHHHFRQIVPKSYHLSSIVRFCKLVGFSLATEFPSITGQVQ